MGSNLRSSETSTPLPPPPLSAPPRVQYIESFIPSLYPSLATIETLIQSNSHINPNLPRYDNLVGGWTLIRREMREIEHEFSSHCREEWDFLNKVDKGLVCSHTLAVVATAYLSEGFKVLDQHDKSIVMWGCFFHDIAKRGPPEMKTKDPLHPFTSASKALRILNRLGLVAVGEEVESTIQVINSSFFKEDWGQFMDNSRLPQIFRKLMYVTGVIPAEDSEFQSYRELTSGMDKSRLYVFEIIAIVLLHQSIDFDAQYPNFTPLKGYEVASYMSPRLLHLLSLLNLGDSGSYSLPYPIDTWDLYKESAKQVKRIMRHFR